MICPYCNEQAELIEDSTPVYGTNFGPLYICEPCGAWVGCHRGTTNPLGRLANSKLRKLKQAAHRSFDPIWKRNAEAGVNKWSARNAAYQWLAIMLDIPTSECHIGMFDEKQCAETVRHCNNRNHKEEMIREGRRIDPYHAN